MRLLVLMIHAAVTWKADGLVDIVVLSVVLVLVCCLLNMTLLRPAGVLEGLQVETTVSETQQLRFLNVQPQQHYFCPHEDGDH